MVLCVVVGVIFQDDETFLDKLTENEVELDDDLKLKLTGIRRNRDLSCTTVVLYYLYGDDMWLSYY